MSVLVIRCGPQARERAGEAALAGAGAGPAPIVLDAAEAPTRRELKPLDEEAKRVLPEDPTPSLAEIAKSPNVSHLGAPRPSPQRPAEPLRVVVVGEDKGLGAVLTRAMRGDYLFAEVAYVPLDDSSPAATNLGLGRAGDPLAFALNAPARPTPLARTDQGLAVAGSASVERDGGGEFLGEVVVDDETILYRGGDDDDAPRPLFGRYGVRLVPMLDAPGLAAAALATPSAPPESGRRPGWWRRRLGRLDAATLYRLWSNAVTRPLVAGAPQPAGLTAPGSVATGRAVQCGGRDMRVVVDGVPARRPVNRATFYRHLRDAQLVRP
ncbi:hypothetical protein [Corynebacterium otitidis]